MYFSASLLQSYKIWWFADQETCIVIISVKNSYAATYYNISCHVMLQKEQNLLEIKFFCYVSTVTFDKWNASLHKSYWPQTFERCYIYTYYIMNYTQQTAHLLKRSL